MTHRARHSTKRGSGFPLPLPVKTIKIPFFSIAAAMRDRPVPSISAGVAHAVQLKFAFHSFSLMSRRATGAAVLLLN